MHRLSGSGYTLPVFAVAATIAAVRRLDSLFQDAQNSGDGQTVQVDLLDGNGMAEVAIEQAAALGSGRALAVTVSDPGENLDLTKGMPIWAEVELRENLGGDVLLLQGGEGLGRSLSGEPAIYHYARRLFAVNVEPRIPMGMQAIVTITLPEGRALAARTSNAAFGIVEGLSLLGTSGISKPLSAEAHLQQFQEALRSKAEQTKQLVFCIGSNGMQVAERLNIEPQYIMQTGNWIGALLLEAGLQEVRLVHLLGYQGKLIKLAGGIFNTSSHLADAKLEILSAAVIQCGGDGAIASAVLNCRTADEAYRLLASMGFDETVFGYLTMLISQKSQAYVKKYANVEMQVKTTLFDRLGNLITPF